MIYLIEQLENLVTDCQKNIRNRSKAAPLAEICGIMSEELRQKVLEQSRPEKALFYSDVARIIMDSLKSEDQKKAKDLLARDRYDLKSLLKCLKGNMHEKPGKS